ncbi:putative Dynein light arm chain [Fasciola gigantica]|nr:putative Dynein light arm chain [Fasciola gigantica]
MGENAPKYVVKNVDMSDEMQQDAFTISNTALQEFNIEKDIAAYIKKEFDRPSPWESSLAGANTMGDGSRKAVVKNADMSEEMQQDAIEVATHAFEKFNIEKDIAAYIKKEFDKKHSPTWHCVVGRNYGSYVTHETKHFIYFYTGQVAILLFKSG